MATDPTRERTEGAPAAPAAVEGAVGPAAAAAAASGGGADAPEPRFVHRLRVRYNECDPQGWVFNANYLMYFDLTLTELWREAFGSYTIMVERGIDMVVAEATVRYRSPARFDEELAIGLTFTRLGETSLASAQRITVDGRVVVDGQMRHVFIDPATGAKAPMPDWVRERLAPYAAA